MLKQLVSGKHRLRNTYWSLVGDEITFTDVDGNMFGYEVIELETLSPFAIEEMTGGNWDLTLFTCTVGGQYRVTVRCVLANGGA